MTMPLIEKYKDTALHIMDICKRLHSRNMLSAADGNISYRVSPTEILITPSGIAKAFMQLSDMAVVTIHNQILSGIPSSERLMHLEVFNTCTKAKAVIHAHPVTAIAWSIAQPEMEKLPSDRALILRRHGAITWGESLEEAYRGMERIENSAQILMTAVQLGGLNPLPPEEVEYLYDLRKKIGDILL